MVLKLLEFFFVTKFFLYRLIRKTLAFSISTSHFCFRLTAAASISVKMNFVVSCWKFEHLVYCFDLLAHAFNIGCAIFVACWRGFYLTKIDVVVTLRTVLAQLRQMWLFGANEFPKPNIVVARSAQENFEILLLKWNGEYSILEKVLCNRYLQILWWNSKPVSSRGNSSIANIHNHMCRICTWRFVSYVHLWNTPRH